MNKALIELYKKRVSSATPLELTNISFELFELYAQEALKHNRDSEEFLKNTKKAKDFIEMMDSTLDREYKVSQELSQIYTYVLKILGDAMEFKDPIFINDAIRVIKPLKRAFKDVEADGYGEINKNIDTNVFAGLTYGRDGLSEFIDDSSSSNNFTV